MGLKITFLGAAGTVTGSKYLLDDGKRQILVDAGMFQGDRSWREKNWEDPPMAFSDISAVIITHAHIDHIGMLPRYVKKGLNCPIYMTASSAALSNLLLLDSGHLQEEEAEYRARKGKSRHHPPLPLYTEEDAKNVAKLVRKVPFDAPNEILPGVFAEWRHAGHILGAASVSLRMGNRKVNFSGDIGRYNSVLLKDPVSPEYGDLLLVESTYGNRLHGKIDPKIKLASVINETSKRNGAVLIPSFAVGRAQQLIYYLRELKHEKLIPDIPVVVDSPMASEVTAIYSGFREECDQETNRIFASGKSALSLSKLYFTKSREESQKLNSIDEPMIIISASGMMTGGRILHHLKHRISDPRTTLLFVGFQPPGGRGDWIKSGAPSLRLFGDEVKINAHLEEISGLSAHADKDELIRWCENGHGKPSKVAVVHGEPESAESFGNLLHEKLKWDAKAAGYLESWEV